MAAADTPNTPEDVEGAAPDRRSVLRGMSTMGMAALVAPLAVRPNDPITDLLNALTGGGGSEPAPSNPSPPSDSPPPADSGPKPKDVHPKGYVKAGLLGDASEIPVNHGKLYEADEYVVTQPKPGKFVGFDSICTHEGCPVDAFDTPGEMDCTCHDTRFKITDGSVISGPAKKPLPKKPIIIENGQIYKAKKAK
jgi:Rieske Fe-S protein